MAAPDVSDLPGGQGLSALAQQVQGDPAAITSIAGIWGTAGTNLSTQTSKVNATVAGIQAAWPTGAGSGSFKNFVDSFQTASRQVSESLSNASTALNNAASVIQQAQGNVNKILQEVKDEASQLQSEITQLQTAKKDASALEAQLQSLAANATPKVKQEIEQAERQLKTVINDLNDAINSAEGKFSALKVPGGGTVSPSFGSGGAPVTLASDVKPLNGNGSPGSSTGGASVSSSSATPLNGSGAAPVGASGGVAIPADTGAATASAAANQALAKSLAPADWTTGTQWDDLVALWNRESGWSNTAMNPTSGAFGIAQALPPSKYPVAGQPTSMGGSADAKAQIQWGLQYIQQRYGSPAAAWAHEEAYGWY